MANDARIHELTFTRGQLKAKTTRLENYVNKLAPNANLTELKIRFEKYNTIYAEFEQIQAELELLDVADTQETEREHFETHYFQLSAKITDLLSKHTDTQTPTPLPYGLSDTNNILRYNTSMTASYINLPVIDLPSFSGEYSEWLSFHDSFNSLIHSNSQLNDIQKFQYLKSALKGNALKTIDYVTVSADNYDIAWNRIKDRYENNRMIIQNHITAILNLPQLTTNTFYALRQLIDTFTASIESLRKLRLPVEHWDALLIQILGAKFDFATKRDWELSIKTKELPTLSQLMDFLSQRCRLLENLQADKVKPKATDTYNLKSQMPKSLSRSLSHVSLKSQNCPLCKERHLIYSCPQLLQLQGLQRVEQIKTLNLCTNCMRDNHKVSQCRGGTCRYCQKKHHSLLHIHEAQSHSFSNLATQPVASAIQPVASATQPAALAAQPVASAIQPVASVTNYCYRGQQNVQVLLSTAIIYVFDCNHKMHECRALLDVGSQSNFISRQMCMKLGLKLKNVSIPISGINQTSSQVSQSVTTHIKSRFNAFSAKLTCFVLPQITDNLPTTSFPVSRVQIPTNIQLADPYFNESKQIDLLLGAELFWNLLCIGQIQTSTEQPHFQKTKLGWIVGGIIPSNTNYMNSSSMSSICTISLKTLEQQVSRFWNVEEPSEKSQSPEDLQCETIFKTTTTRNSQGRFIVHLPFKPDSLELGWSRDTAIKRFRSVERKLLQNSVLRNQYVKFMQEYLSLGHMEPVPSSENVESSSTYYLPHHAVMREESVSTKLRVVFDGSSKTSNGVSLNQNLLVGPTLQQELFAILLRFRTYQYVICSDISKMYRQILVHPLFRSFQRIVWRFRPQDPIETYGLTTVTYGTTSAPYLAIRCLRELALTDGIAYPRAQKAILNDFYVDDLLTGVDTPEEGIKLIQQVQQILAKGKFELHKWSSNSPEIMASVSSMSHSESSINLTKHDEPKTLGVLWNQSADTLSYSTTHCSISKQVTKRIILSTIAHFFDPLGLIGPIFITAKILLQKLWSIKLGWDEAIPQSLHTAWIQFTEQLPLLSEIRIPRKVILKAKPKVVQLHGFSDASESAYGACIYIKTVQDSGAVDVHLLCSKSRVAPLKSITLPRLELCGAVLLAKLMDKISKVISISNLNCFYWTDSCIVLSWIAKSANSWKTFVCNRVAEIQTLTKIEDWRHIRSQENPADLISRGMLPRQLRQSTLWWHGPLCLTEDIHNYRNDHQTSPESSNIVELEQRRTCHVAATYFDNELLYKFSTYTKLQRVVAFCLRFIYNLKDKQNKKTGYLTYKELQNATTYIIRILQQGEFAPEINSITTGKSVNKNSKLVSLNPFVDQCGLLRVGGRLAKANLLFDKRFPIVLPSKHHITVLLIKREHVKQLHAGARATLAALRQQFWPLDGYNTVRSVLRKCIPCFRAKPVFTEQLMGELPISRIEPARAFVRCGVDYGGPIFIKEGRGRGKRSIKSYIVLFVCLVTKAVHLELVYDCTTETFLYALKRFISRRGKPADLYSDNGKNFVGAEAELKSLKTLFTSQQFDDAVIKHLCNENINWHFIPANAPHFGGIWEAGIKSTKYHLKRIVGSASLTYDEMYTILTQIEACLNSRPITSLTNDPNDLNVLTPGHFLIGSPLTTIPEPDLLPLNEHRLSRWQRIQQITQHFWTRWSMEYLSSLHQRTKWRDAKHLSTLPGKVVIVRDDNLPPLCWKLARIVEVHPGKDGLIRAVTVQTKSGVFKRPLTKISLLPNESDITPSKGAATSN